MSEQLSCEFRVWCSFRVRPIVFGEFSGRRRSRRFTLEISTRFRVVHPLDRNNPLQEKTEGWNSNTRKMSTILDRFFHAKEKKKNRIISFPFLSCLVKRDLLVFSPPFLSFSLTKFGGTSFVSQITTGKGDTSIRNRIKVEGISSKEYHLFSTLKSVRIKDVLSKITFLSFFFLLKERDVNNYF